MIKVLSLFVVSIFITMTTSTYSKEIFLMAHSVPANKNVMIKTFYDNENFTGYHIAVTQFCKKRKVTITHFILSTNDIHEAMAHHRTMVCNIFSRYMDDPSTFIKAKLMQCNLQRTAPMND